MGRGQWFGVLVQLKKFLDVRLHQTIRHFQLTICNTPGGYQVLICSMTYSYSSGSSDDTHELIIVSLHMKVNRSVRYQEKMTTENI